MQTACPIILMLASSSAIPTEGKVCCLFKTVHAAGNELLISAAQSINISLISLSPTKEIDRNTSDVML